MTIIGMQCVKLSLTLPRPFFFFAFTLSNHHLPPPPPPPPFIHPVLCVYFCPLDVRRNKLVICGLVYELPYRYKNAQRGNFPASMM